jgi:two-component system, sensor histidine kinase and response regulator
MSADTLSADRPARILVVDDEPSVLETIVAILNQDGYQTASVGSVDAALALLHSEPFDVVLTDLRMEGQSGLSLIAEIQRRWSDTTTIVLTCSASFESAIDALRGGAYDYLIKPCHVEELKATVARAVERGALAHALRDRVRELDEVKKKLRSMTSQLEKRVEEATAELSRKVEELAAAKQQLEDAERQRLEFTAVVAHELNQPLTTISGSAQLLSRKGLPPEMEERSRSTIVTETRRLARLVQDLTDASEMASGRFQIQLGACDLAEIAREQVDQMVMSRTAQDVTLEVDAEQTAIACDADRIAQVISNLISNASKYAPRSPIRVAIRNVDGKVQLSVSDEGPGVPPDRREAIFEPRVRLMDTESGRAKRGRGLGLFIARNIVEAHGGRIWAASGDQGGAVFTVELPVRTGS